MYEWDDLSDDELRARLVNKGAPDDIAGGWVRHRDTEPDRSMIEEALEGSWP